jgi:transposase
LKRCSNSDCIRDIWNRDVNAAINILNLFLAAVLSKKDKDNRRCCTASTTSRPEAFRKTAALDE